MRQVHLKTIFIKRIRAYYIGLLAFYSMALNPLASQTSPTLIVDNQIHDVPYSGTYQDFIIPSNAARIIFNVKGGDGGKARATYDDGAAVSQVCNENGGQGASIEATFAVGTGNLLPGKAIRFIVGQAGENGNRHTHSAGGGGGASAVLYKFDQWNYDDLIIAGAGGGAYQGVFVTTCVDNSPGGGGNYGPNGDRGGGDINRGGGGTDGNGGGSNGNVGGGGGGGRRSDGDGIFCEGTVGFYRYVGAEGHAAFPEGSEPGQSEGCSAIANWRRGGYGYGSGGAGADVGGGGGGYSGGGSGGSTGGGGGGGSYVAPTRVSETGSDGATSGSPQNGTITYRCIPRPDNDLCANARTLTCGGSTSGDTEFATADGAPTACQPKPGNGVWFKFTGTGDIMQLSSAGTNYDAKLLVYKGVCGNFTCVGTDDNSAGNGQAVLSFCSEKNAQYYAYLETIATSGGAYQVALTCSNTPPSITCPNNIVKNTDPGQCHAVTNYSVSSADNCSSFVYRLSGPASGSNFPKGTTTVVWEAQDGTGTTASCSFSVTVNDAENPHISCPANMQRQTDPNQCFATVFHAPAAYDNCPNVASTQLSGPASGSAFPSGSTSTILWKATDAAGLTATCSFTVTVTDAQPPSITCPANIVRSNDPNQCGAVVSYSLPTASDNCGIMGFDYLDGGLSNSTFPGGTTTVTWMVTDVNNLTATCTFTITVNDTQQPSITCPANMVRNTNPGACHATVTYNLPTYSDNCASLGLDYLSGGLSGSNFPKGTTTVVWMTTDAANNTRTCSFRIIVNDIEAPVITCPQAQTAAAAANQCSAIVTYPAATATDNCTASPTVVRIGGPASGSTFPTGTTNVTWRAIDGANRSSTCSFAVTVSDNTPPNITCPMNTTVNTCNSPVFYNNPTATDNCGVNAVFLTNGEASGSVFPIGVNTVTWRANDVNGLSATCSFTVTVTCSPTPPDGSSTGARIGVQLQQAGEVQKLEIRLSPNPAQSTVRYVLSNTLDDTSELFVSDALGRVVLRQVLQSDQRIGEFDVTEWSAGLYRVSVRTGKTVATKGLVVKGQ